MVRIASVKAISFDGDGTLWDFEKVMQHSLQHVLKELERLDPPATAMLDIEKMIKIRNRVAKELKGRITNLEKIRLEAFKQTLKDIGRPNDVLATHLNNVYLKHRFEDVELYSDVLPTLEALRKNFVIGLLSNGNNYPERCGLEGIFQFVIFSQDYNVEKPDPGIFKIALEKAGCSEKEMLHVGDSLEIDIAGAKTAGIKSVWLNRQKAKANPSFQIDYEISSLSELLQIVEPK
jgi:putative hydrolase of the HAD superfamily